MSEEDRSIVHVYTLLYGPDVLSDVRQIIEADDDVLNAAIDNLPRTPTRRRNNL